MSANINKYHKQNDLSQFLLNIALVYATSRVQVDQGNLKLNGTHQLLVYVDDVDILGRSDNTKKQNSEDLIVAVREIGLEVNGDENKYMVMCRD